MSAAVDRYLPLVDHLASWQSRRAELRAWIAALGPATDPAGVDRVRVLQVRSGWRGRGVSPKTVNNRSATLAHFYRTLYGHAGPCVGVRRMDVPRTVPQSIPPDLILRVDRALHDGYRSGWIATEKTRARLAVLAATGRRPSEIMRARPSDVDLHGRTWRVRDGKGGFTPGGLYLAKSGRAAWRIFKRAAAWGAYDTSAFARTLRRHGWPADIRPYELRHAAGIAMSAAGVDLADVGAALGHKSTDLTRSVYVPIIGSRMQAAAEALEAARPLTFAHGAISQLSLDFDPVPDVRPDPVKAGVSPAWIARMRAHGASGGRASGDARRMAG